MKEEKKCFYCGNLTYTDICPIHDSIRFKKEIDKMFCNNTIKSFGKEWREWLVLLLQALAIAGLFIPILTHLGFGFLERISMIFGISWIFAKNDWI